VGEMRFNYNSRSSREFVLFLMILLMSAAGTGKVEDKTRKVLKIDE
jgi:hypothetical protein